MKMNLVNELIQLTSRSTIAEMRGNQKQAYRYAICAIFINIIVGHHLQHGQKVNLMIAEDIRNRPKGNVSETEFNNIKKTVIASLKGNQFRKPASDETVTTVIQFFREILDEIRTKGNSMFMAEKLDKIIDVQKLFHAQGAMILNHHWLEFDFYKGLIPTYPTAILFNDLKVHWNKYVDELNLLREGIKEIENQRELLEFEQKEATRERRYTISCLMRTLVFTAVTFVESYLYDLYYNIKQTDIPNKELIKGPLNIKKINDVQIIEKILFVLFPYLKQLIEHLFIKYRDVILIERDRYVHASSFAENNVSKMLNLITLNDDKVTEYLETCVQLVLKIENSLPNDLKLLFWWGWYEGEADFSKLEKMPLINKEAGIAQLKYYPDRI